MLAIENMDGKEDHRRTIGDDEEYDSEEDAYEEADVPSNYLPSEKIEEKTYTVLSEEDISQRQEEEVEKVSSTPPYPSQKMRLLLFYFISKWNAEWVTDGWFAKEENIRRDLV